MPCLTEEILNRNKMRLTKEEEAFATDFFFRRSEEISALDAVIPRKSLQNPPMTANPSPLREDTVSSFNSVDTLLAPSPDTADGYFKVPSVKVGG